jgi:predicted phage tail protein
VWPGARAGIIESEGAAILVGGVDQVFSQQSRQEAGGQSEDLGRAGRDFGGAGGDVVP